MDKEYSCLVCKHFDPDNIEINHHRAIICFCEHDGPSLKPCRKFELNEAKYNAKRFEPASNIVPIEIPKNTYKGELDVDNGTLTIYPSSTNEMNKILEFLCKLAKEKDIIIEFGGGLCDDAFPSFRVRQYRNNPKTDKVYTVYRIIDIDDLTINNVEFKEFIDNLTKYFDKEFNEMFEKEEKNE